MSSRVLWKGGKGREGIILESGTQTQPGRTYVGVNISRLLSHEEDGLLYIPFSLYCDITMATHTAINKRSLSTFQPDSPSSFDFVLERMER